MKKLIDFKLHNGQFPYFVEDVIGGVEIGGKRFGLSRDSDTCYLPDTVTVYDEASFIQAVKKADIYSYSDSSEESRLMTEAEKEVYCRDWVTAALKEINN